MTAFIVNHHSQSRLTCTNLSPAPPQPFGISWLAARMFIGWTLCRRRGCNEQHEGSINRSSKIIIEWSQVGYFLVHAAKDNKVSIDELKNRRDVFTIFLCNSLNFTADVLTDCPSITVIKIVRN